MARTSLATMVAAPTGQRDQFVQDARMVLTANTPATTDEVGRTILMLLTMYPDFDRRQEASKTLVIATWRSSLTGWPADILAEATKEWIEGPKAAFTPQPGDIIKACERIGGFRRAMAKKAADFLELVR